MDAERYQRAKAIFFEACEQEQPERIAFVERQCANDPPLRAIVLNLLQHDEDPMTVMKMTGNASALRERLERLADSRPALHERGQVVEPGVTEQANPGGGSGGGSVAASSIGRYRILGLLGSGGMGVVHLAEQENPRRRVALKVIRPGSASSMTLRRFEHEAHVLGLLQHPNIAQIHEAGTFDAGLGTQPFFAMELVQGRPLLRHCEETRANLRTRLELFLKVCDAVEYAHCRGVVHRDLKPANILVDESATAPQPKVLDFGVARLTGDDREGGGLTTMHTAAGQLVGTVAYMSPEQFSGDSQQIDARSDVFALGAILFELLSGRLPHDLANKSIPESIRIVSEAEPAALATMNRACRGDLDTIVSKALERDKARRYQSASELAADVNRYLRDEPIQARPPSTLYQFRKFARRNKSLVGGAAAVFMALVAGIITTTWQARSATAHARRAEAEADKAMSVSDFLQRMLASARPAVAQGRELSVREVLDEAAIQLDRAAGGALAPEVEGALRVTIARAYLALDLHEAAQPHLDVALERLGEAYGQEHETIADCLEAMGRAAGDRGDWEQAERLTRQALDMINRLQPGDHELKAQVLASLGWLVPEFNNVQESERCLSEAIAMLTRLRGPDDLDVAGLKVDLASISHSNPVHNEHMVLEAIDAIIAQRGDRHPNLPRALNLLGAYQQIGGRLEEAEASYRRAFDVRLAVHGRDALAVIDSVQLLAWVATAKGECPKATALLAEYLPHARIAMREDNPLLAGYLVRLATSHQTCGEAPVAIEFLREGLTLLDASGSAPTPILGKALASLAMLLSTAGEDDQAMRYAERCLGLPDEVAPAGSAARGQALLVLGEVQGRRGEFEAAEQALRESERILRRSGPGVQPHRSRAIKSMVAMYEQWDTHDPGSHQAEIQRWRAMLPRE